MKEWEENKPFVSIIIPCRDEEKFIKECINSIIANDYPKERLEILIVDGMSEDRTREIVKSYIEKYPYIKLLNNSQKYTPFALNIGIKQAKGEIIMRMDAHATYKNDYISKCLKYLNEYKADNVGGIWITMSKKNTLVGKSIAFALSHPFGAGNAYYRMGGQQEPKEVDTVPFGCYKKEVFEEIGLFNEHLIRNQDLEFNLRLRKAGGKILLAPDIVAYYYPKSNLKDFLKHNFEDAIWVTYPLKFGAKAFSWRHLVPLIFVSGLIGTGILGIFFPVFLWLFLNIIILYLLINLYFSLSIAIKEKNFRYLSSMPIVFLVRHISYGLGSLWGITKIYLKK